MPLHIVRNDITKMFVDAIVNSANPLPVIGYGVDSQIHKVAGKELLEARKEIGEIACGEAKITGGYHLPAKYVIHTVGPNHASENVYELLRDCYRNSLMLAKEQHCESIAFPLISTGTYGVSKTKALQIAIQTIHEFLFEQEMIVYLVVFDKESYQLSEHLYVDIESYIDEKYVDENYHVYPRAMKSSRDIYYTIESEDEEIVFNECLTSTICGTRSLEDLVNEVEDTFSEHLFRLIDNKGMKDPEVYKKANIDRRHFSKIRSNKDYQPSKITVIALAFALELNLDETKDLLLKAGYALSHSNKLDIIVEYFLVHENYNIFELNEVLFAFDQPTIGG